MMELDPSLLAPASHLPAGLLVHTNRHRRSLHSYPSNTSWDVSQYVSTQRELVMFFRADLFLPYEL